MTPPYRDYAAHLREYFPDRKINKLTIDAGFSCPNRDGTIGRGGCSYCNNSSFSPTPGGRGLSVTEQLERGKQFFARKYPKMQYLAYFQSYTNTHAPADRLIALYEEALACPDIVGLIIGTRPDCVNSSLLERIASLKSQCGYIMIEYGAESANDEALKAVNRCHTWADTVNAVTITRQTGLLTGLHLINGLPGDSHDTIMHTVDCLNNLHPDTVKFHQLQIIRGTRLAAQVESGTVSPTIYSIDDYISLCCEIISRISPDIAIERFVSSSPAELLLAPRWGLKNHEFTDRLVNELRRRQNDARMKLPTTQE